MKVSVSLVLHGTCDLPLTFNFFTGECLEGKELTVTLGVQKSIY